MHSFLDTFPFCWYMCFLLLKGNHQISWALRGFEWVKLHRSAYESGSEQGFYKISGVRKSGMIPVCENCGDLKIRIASRAFVRVPPSEESLVTPRCESCGSSAGGKNHLWHLWALPAGVLRSQGALDTGPALWRHAGLPGGGDPAGVLPELRQGETRETGVAGRQPPVHPTLCLVRGPAVPGGPDSSGGPGIVAGLAHGQGAGEAVHAGTVAASGDAEPAGDWDR